MSTLRSMQEKLNNASVSDLYELTLEQQVFQSKIIRRLVRFLFYTEPLVGTHLCAAHKIKLDNTFLKGEDVRDVIVDDNNPSYRRVDDVINGMVEKYSDPKKFNEFVNLVSNIVDSAVMESRKYSMIGQIYGETIFKNVYLFAKSCRDLIDSTKEITRFVETRKNITPYEVLVKLKALNEELLTRFDKFAESANVNAENLINFFQYDYEEQADAQRNILARYRNTLALWRENPYFQESNIVNVSEEIENDRLIKSREMQAQEKNRIQAINAKRAEESELGGLNDKFQEIKNVLKLLSKCNDPQLNGAALNLEFEISNVESKYHFPLSKLPNEEKKVEMLGDLNKLTEFVNGILAELGYHINYGINDIRSVVDEYYGSERKSYFLDDGMNKLNKNFKENLKTIRNEVDLNDLSVTNAAGIIASYQKIVELYNSIQNLKEGTHYPEVQDLFSKQ